MHRGDEADLDARLVGAEERLLDQRVQVAERPAALLRLERAEQDRARGQEEEEQRVDEERKRSEPREREAPPAGHDIRPERPRCDVSRRRYPIFEDHCCAIRVFAFVCCPLLANFTFA